MNALFHVVVVFLSALVMFSIFQVIGRRTKRDILLREKTHKRGWDGIVVAVLLISLISMYGGFLFFEMSVVFPSEPVQSIMFEANTDWRLLRLLGVILFNLFLVINCLKRVVTEKKSLRIILKVLYALFIVVSGLLIVAGLNRVHLHEGIYGFTVEKFLYSAFLLFLLVIYAYTFIRVWIENLSILHFYLITAFVFYILLQVVNIEGIVVENNIERYKTTGEVNLAYMSELGAEGIKGIFQLYESEPEKYELQQILLNKTAKLEVENDSWQSYNFAREEAKDLLRELKEGMNE